jgi:FAD:protein FMN transferase
MARDAMATRFEFVLLGENPVQLRAAGEEAFDEIQKIEAQLSLFNPSSEIAQINARAAFGPVRVTPMTFALIDKARTFSELTGGAFDITVAPLVRCWGFMKGSGARPTDQEIAEARRLVGMHLLELDSAVCTVHFKREGMMLDLGSIGKGYALDVAAEILRDAGVENALLHGGTSTIYGLGRDISGPWKIALEKPEVPSSESAQPDAQKTTIAVILLENQAMSVSAVWGKFFVLDGKTYGHVIDARSGWPTQNALLGCVVVDSATDSDALSTGVLLASPSEIKMLEKEIPNLRYLQARIDETKIAYLAKRIELMEGAEIST